jgi:acetoin utilization protein AcuC
MACTLHVAWDERLTSYDFGPDHPLAPVRVELTVALADAFGVLSGPGVTVTAPAAASQAELELVHDPRYITAVRTGIADAAFGLGTPDNPVFSGMHEASALVAGATLAAAAAVWESRAQHAVNVAGGLHHAMRAMASGFCVYNDPAIAIRWLLAQGAERIAYVDVDVHHGDGVEAAFYDDPRVLTISLHEHPMTLFPGTGLPRDDGGPGAEGMAVNVALPAGTGDAGWLRAFNAVVPPLLRAFRPQVLVSQHGCDTHRLDPLAHLELSIDAQRTAHARLHHLAHETAGGRWVLTGGGGYELDPSARRGGGRAAGPGRAHAAVLARVRPRPDRCRPAADHDRRRPGLVLAVLLGLRPGRLGGPGDHGHPQRGLRAARAAAVPLNPGAIRGEMPINAAWRGRTHRRPAAPAPAPAAARSVPGVTK